MLSRSQGGLEMATLTGISATDVTRSVLASFDRSTHRREPYDYWLLSNVLPDETCEGIASLPFPAPHAPVFDGRRESNNSTRVYFNPENQARFPACRALAQAFDSDAVRRSIERLTGTRLANGKLRIEYCQDRDGFWLEPHVDIPVKLFTMLVYLAKEPELSDAGTDIFDASPEHKRVATAPCEWNKGLIFIPGKNTWHGFSPRPIRGLRKSIIVNYVAPEWRAVDELA
jgi:hypothetical protein